jgi:hypothetical protein
VRFTTSDLICPTKRRPTVARNRNNRLEEQTVNEQTPQAPEAAPPKAPPPPAAPAATVPNGERGDPLGERPVIQWGPYPTPEKRTMLTVAIWRREPAVPETTEVVTSYNVVLTRTAYNGDNKPEISSIIRPSELPLAILLLNKARAWLAAQEGL